MHLVPKNIKVEQFYRPMAEWFRNLDCDTYQSQVDQRIANWRKEISLIEDAIVNKKTK